MSNDERPEPGSEFQRDVHLEKPGIVGARWWQKSLVEDATSVRRRDVLKGLAVAGGVLGAIGLGGYALSRLFSASKEPVSLAKRSSLEMQKAYGWDFGARGEALVFDGKVETPFVRSELEKLPDVMTPRRNAKYYVGTLVESLLAKPAMELPTPSDGSARLDAAPFQRLADVIVPIVTPAMEKAYRVGEAFARLCEGRPAVAALVDLFGPEAVAFAAGACSRFEPVLLFDNWPHPHGVVPSHLTLAALAYYQPRFTEQAISRTAAEPLFVLDRARLSAYFEESDRFDNRYYARVPNLDLLSRDGIHGLFYVVSSSNDLPAPADVHAVLAQSGRLPSAPPAVAVRALSLADFADETGGFGTGPLYYGGSYETDGSFWVNYPIAPGSTPRPEKIAHSTTAGYTFPQAAPTPAASNVGKVAVLVTASGLLIGAALDRRGSMNRFSGGWAG